MMTKSLQVVIDLTGEQLDSARAHLRSQPLLPKWKLLPRETDKALDLDTSVDLVVASPASETFDGASPRKLIAPTVLVVDRSSEHRLPALIGLHGIRAIVLAHDLRATLALAIAAAASRGVWVPEPIWKRLETVTTEPIDVTNSLTVAENETFWLVAQGMTNTEIARARHVQPSTVKYHVKNIRYKTGAASRRDLIALAHRHPPTRPRNTPPYGGGAASDATRA